MRPERPKPVAEVVNNMTLTFDIKNARSIHKYCRKCMLGKQGAGKLLRTAALLQRTIAVISDMRKASLHTPLHNILLQIAYDSRREVVEELVEKKLGAHLAPGRDPRNGWAAEDTGDGLFHVSYNGDVSFYGRVW